MMTPKISILLSSYNSAGTLEEALQSLSTQSLSDYELLLIDDASTDDTQKVLEKFRADPRIRIFQNEKNQGLAKNLNTLIEQSRGQYLARMDADDISERRRLEIQSRFLDQNPDIVGVGGAYRYTSWRGWKPNPNARDPEELKARLLFENPFCHPAMMLRLSLFREQGFSYDEGFEVGQDLDLWDRVTQVAKLSNVEPTVLRQRRHSGQVSTKKKEKQFQSICRIKKRQLERLGLCPEESDISSLAKLTLCYRWDLRSGDVRGELDFARIESVLNSLLQANKQSQVYQQDVLEILSKEWLIRLLERKRSSSNGLGFKMKAFDKLRIHSMRRVRALLS
jgi:glycosyltransferase involved in cell wall biosynthesis